jgi:hypothetical protein
LGDIREILWAGVVRLVLVFVNHVHLTAQQAGQFVKGADNRRIGNPEIGLSRLLVRSRTSTDSR